MNKPVEGEVLEREVAVTAVEAGALAMLNKSEIDMQITTAHRFPRSVTKFQGEATSLVSLTEAVADDCIYSLPRDGKNIEGPSARFAEIMLYCWGNCRAGARIVDEEREFVTAQGIFWDLEKNAAIGFEVKRRITDKHGKRYSPDMIGVTANAASSIAIRNAILKGIPKALWNGMYETARKTIMGDFQTLANRRAAALAAFQKFGIQPERIFEKLAVRGEEDITLEHIVTLRGMLNALKDGDSTPEEMFPAASQPNERSAAANLKSAVKEAAGTATAAQPAGDKTAPAKPAAQPQPEPKKAKPAGTPEQAAQFAKKLSECKDTEILALVRDEANGYAWSDEDRAAIDAVYQKRLKDIEL